MYNGFEWRFGDIQKLEPAIIALLHFSFTGVDHIECISTRIINLFDTDSINKKKKPNQIYSLKLLKVLKTIVWNLLSGEIYYFFFLEKCSFAVAHIFVWNGIFSHDNDNEMWIPSCVFWWSSREVFSFIVRRPIHQIYDRPANGTRRYPRFHVDGTIL